MKDVTNSTSSSKVQTDDVAESIGMVSNMDIYADYEYIGGIILQSTESSDESFETK
jgi:hypothetical protein